MSIRDLFPRYVDGPEGKSIAISVLYLLVRYFLLTGLLLILGSVTINEDGSASSILVIIGQLLIDLVVMFLIYRQYLSDALLTFQMEWKSCLKTIAIGVGIAAVVSGIICIFTGFPVPTGDLFLQFPTYYFAFGLVPGILVLVILMPVAFCCLFHATFFGGLCGQRPWLAYPLVAAVLLILHWLSDHALSGFPGVYLSMLPTHLCACWVYQKTNTIWSSIILVAAVNLLMVLTYMLLPQLALNALFSLIA